MGRARQVTAGLARPPVESPEDGTITADTGGAVPLCRGTPGFVGRAFPGLTPRALRMASLRNFFSAVQPVISAESIATAAVKNRIRGAWQHRLVSKRERA